MSSLRTRRHSVTGSSISSTPYILTTYSNYYPMHTSREQAQSSSSSKSSQFSWATNGLKLCLRFHSTLEVSTFPSYINLFASEKGRTLHLLKQCSKPVTTGRKRKKYGIAGTLGEYKQAVEAENSSINSFIQGDSAKQDINEAISLGNVSVRQKNNSWS